MDEKKTYYIQLPEYSEGEVWDEEKYNRNREKLATDHPNAIVKSGEKYDGGDFADEDTFRVQLPDYEKAEIWDGAKFRRNREKLLSDYPNVEISRYVTPSYDEELNFNDEPEGAPKEIPTPEPTVEEITPDAEAQQAEWKAAQTKYKLLGAYNPMQDYLDGFASMRKAAMTPDMVAEKSQQLSTVNYDNLPDDERIYAKARNTIQKSELIDVVQAGEIAAKKAENEKNRLPGFLQGWSNAVKESRLGLRQIAGELAGAVGLNNDITPERDALSYMVKYLTGKESAAKMFGSKLSKPSAEDLLASLDVAVKDKDGNYKLVPFYEAEMQAAYENMGWLGKMFDKSKKDAIAEKYTKDKALYDTIKQYLADNGNDVEKAFDALERKAGPGKMSRREFMTREVSKEMASLPETSGIGAWLGGLMPMIGTMAAGAGAATFGRTAAQLVGKGTMAGFAAGMAGNAMNQARMYGASDEDTWAAGLASAAIMYAAGKIPFNRFTNRVFSSASSSVRRQLSKGLSDPNSPLSKEAELLWKNFRKQYGTEQLFSKEHFRQWLSDMAASGTSFGVMGALEQMVPMIYANPEDYPEFNQIFQAAIHGFIDGVAIGGVGGAAAIKARHDVNLSRWNAQGGMMYAELDNGMLAEIVGTKEPGAKGGAINLPRIDKAAVEHTTADGKAIFGDKRGALAIQPWAEPYAKGGLFLKTPEVPDGLVDFTPRGDIIYTVLLDGKLVDVPGAQLAASARSFTIRPTEKVSKAYLDLLKDAAVDDAGFQEDAGVAQAVADKAMLDSESRLNNAGKVEVTDDEIIGGGLTPEQTDAGVDFVTSKAVSDEIRNERRGQMWDYLFNNIGRKFWRDDDGGDGGEGGGTPPPGAAGALQKKPATGKVSVIQFTDGRELLVVGEDAKDYSVVDTEGNMSMIPKSEVGEDIKAGRAAAHEHTIDEYLDFKIAEQDAIAEQERMNRELSENLTALVDKVQADKKINLGTPEAELWADVTVVDPIVEGGITVVGENGEKVMNWQEVADALNMPFIPKTNEQLATDQVNTAKAVRDEILKSNSEEDEAPVAEEAPVKTDVFSDSAANKLGIPADYAVRDEQDGTVSVNINKLWTERPDLLAKYNDRTGALGMSTLEFLQAKKAVVDNDIAKQDAIYKQEMLGAMRQDKIKAISAERARLVERGKQIADIMVPYQVAAQMAAEAQAEIAQQQAAAAEESTAVGRILKDSKGNMLFEKAEVGDSAAALIELANGNINSAIKTAEKMVSISKEKAQKARKSPVKGTNPVEIINNTRDKEAKVAELDKVTEYWADVTKNLTEERARRYKKENDTTLYEPQTLEEVVANTLYGLPLQSLDKENFRKETGWSDKELKSFFPWWAKKGQGMSLQQLAEQIGHEDTSGFVPQMGEADQADTQAIRDAILSVLHEISKPSDLKTYTRDRNLERRAEEEAYYEGLEEYEKEQAEIGPFGVILRDYVGKPKEAIQKLIELKSGEAIGALSHPGIGSIDLVWGDEGTGHSDGFGLAKLVKYHPEAVEHLQEILDDMVIVSKSDNRINLESERYKAAVRLTWDEQRKTWLLTVFEKKNSVLDNTTDTVKTSNGSMQNDTATLQNAVSESKDTNNSEKTIVSEAIPDETPLQEEIAQAEAEVNTEPTEAQKQAGNYKMGHVTIDGFDVTIENPKGSVRRGVSADGKEWETKMNNTYGYIRGTEGVDGDHIDVFLSDNPEQGNVFVVDQIDPKTGKFDEHKVMYGFGSADEARNAYLSNYEEGWQGLGTITEVTKEEFKKWVDSSHRKTKPFSEYKSVSPEVEDMPEDIFEGKEPEETDNKVAKEIAETVQQITDKDAELEELYVKSAEDKIDNKDERLKNIAERAQLKNKLIKQLTDASDEQLAALSNSESKAVAEAAQEEVKKRESRVFELNVSSYIAKNQNVPAAKAKPATKINPFDYTSKEDNRPLMMGVYHDGGYAVATDATVLIADKGLYDEKLEGKVVGKNGNKIDGQFPRWRDVIPAKDAVHTEKVDFGKLRDFLAGIKAAREAEWNKLKADGKKVGSKANYVGDAKVVLNVGGGQVIGFKYNTISRLADYAEHIGAKELRYVDNRRAVSVETSKGIGLGMPILTTLADAKGYEVAEAGQHFIDLGLYSYGENAAQKAIRLRAAQDAAFSLIGTTREQALKDRLQRKLSEIDRGIRENPDDYAGLMDAKAKVIQEYADEAKAGNNKVVSCSLESLAESLAKEGYSYGYINKVQSEIEYAHKEKVRARAFRAPRGDVFMIADDLIDAKDVATALAHEEEHNVTVANGDHIWLASIADRDNLLAAIDGWVGEIPIYHKLSDRGVANEFISHAIERTENLPDDSIEKTLGDAGVNNPEIVNFVKNRVHERRIRKRQFLSEDRGLRRADRIQYGSVEENIGQNGRNSETGSGRNLGGQGFGFNAPGAQGARSGEVDYSFFPKGVEGANLAHAFNQKNLVFKQRGALNVVSANGSYYLVKDNYYPELHAYSTGEVEVITKAVAGTEKAKLLESLSDGTDNGSTEILSSTLEAIRGGQGYGSGNTSYARQYSRSGRRTSALAGRAQPKERETDEGSTNGSVEKDYEPSFVRDLNRAERSRVEDIDRDGVHTPEITDNLGEETSEGTTLFALDKGSKTLVGLHNISTEKLIKAIRLGGLANPSCAVIDLNYQNHFEYGDITFVMPSSLIGKHSGRNAGTWVRDAWTPTFPKITFHETRQSQQKLDQMLSDLPKDLKFLIEHKVYDFINGDTYHSGLEYMFLKEKGMEPEIQVNPRKYPNASEQEFFGKYLKHPEMSWSTTHGSDIMDAYDALSPEEKKMANMYVLRDGDMSKIEHALEMEQKWPHLKEVHEEPLSYASIDSFLYKIMRDERDAGQENLSLTVEKAIQSVSENNLADEFNAWQDETINNLGYEQKIFIGYTDSGRKYKAATLENISKEMKKEGNAGSQQSNGLSFGSIMASMAKKLNSLMDIRAERNRLVPKDEYETLRGQMMDEAKEYFFTFYDENIAKKEAELVAADYVRDFFIKGMDIDKVVETYNKEQHKHLVLTDKEKAAMNDFRQRMKDLPTDMFETKFERPVYLNEFAAVVVPDDLPLTVRKALEDSGLKLFTYKGDERSDSRRQAVKEAAASRDDILFSFIGKTGAASMDQVEKSHERMDNLAVARQMEGEGKDPSAIKWATGWERGKDDMWRYEIPDFTKFDLFGDVMYDKRNPDYVRYKELVRKSNAAALMPEQYPSLTNEESDEYVALGEKYGIKKQERKMLQSGMLEDFIDSEELFKAYPQLRRYFLRFDDKLADNVGGYAEKGGIVLNMKNRFQYEKLSDNLVHEIQHEIQDIEGFSIGTSLKAAGQKAKVLNSQPKVKLSPAEYDFLYMGEYYYESMSSDYRKQVPFDMYLEDRYKDGMFDAHKEFYDENIKGKNKEELVKLYNRLLITSKKRLNLDSWDVYKMTSGEVEARNVSRRRTFSAEQRRNLAEDTEDVSRADQILNMPAKTLLDWTDDDDFSVAQSLQKQPGKQLSISDNLSDETDFSLVTDKAELDRLEKEPTVTLYRAMELIDGQLYPPMSQKVPNAKGERGKKLQVREGLKLGVWQKADEDPDKAYQKKPDGPWYYDLKKIDPKQSDVNGVLYNPYLHLSASPLNDQFSAAFTRPNLVTVACEVPVSELTGNYKAEKANDSIGPKDWHSGTVTAQLGDGRQVVLSRYAKATRIVPDSEVAAMIAPKLKEKNITVPSNVVTPSLKAELQKRGVKFTDDKAVDETSKEETLFSFTNRNNEIFVSNAQRAAEGIKMEKATPGQWLKMLEKEGGLKAGEDKWIGLSDWLRASDKKTITKQEVLDYIGENKIQIEETHYTELDDFPAEFKKKYPEFDESYAFDTDGFYNKPFIDSVTNIEKAVSLYNKHHNDKIILNEDWENPGNSITNWDYRKLIAYGAELLDEATANEINSTRIGYTTEGLDNKHEIALTVPTIEPYNENDKIHFGDAGEGRAIAWVRFGDAIISSDNDIAKEKAWSRMNEAERKEHPEIEPQGTPRQRVLFIDEIQSKRHQDAREKGYVDKTKYHARRNDVTKDKGWDVFKGEEFLGFVSDIIAPTEADALKQAEAYDMKRGIPAAPFEKNWPELAFKRMLRYAAEEGYDYVAWTTGEQQAKRYDIGHVLHYVTRDNDYPDGAKRFELGLFGGGADIVLKVDNDANIIASKNADFTGKKLSDVVGKDIAARMMTLEVDEDIDADHMLIGAEGMKGFYDDILPRFANKYCKKWGVSVEDMEFPGLENGIVAHAIPITPEMKESVMEGQPMFSFHKSSVAGEDGKETVFVHSGGMPTGTVRNSLVERTYKKSGAFSFTGKDKIESAADVAYIFKELEDSAVENAFLVFIKGGRPTIVHVGMGTIGQVQVDELPLVAGIKDFAPDEVYLVHNHPSGRVEASMADVSELEVLQRALGDVPIQGVIIDTTSGEYGLFTGDDFASTMVNQRPGQQDEAIPLEVLTFDKMVFSPDYKRTQPVRNAEDVASYLSAHRLGNGSKISALMLAKDQSVVGNLVFNQNELTNDNFASLAQDAVDAAVRSAASSIILTGDFNVALGPLSRFRSKINQLSANRVSMLDVVKVEGNHTRSLAEGTLMEPGVKAKALETAVPGGKSPFKATVISSADGAKVINNLNSLAEQSEKLTLGQKKSFLKDLAVALGAERRGSKSQYATFEAKNGTVFTLRLANHNATVSNFDNLGEDNGISIVISRKANLGVKDDGKAHVEEFFYSDKVLRKADNKPYAKIVRSIIQAMYSGVYKDTTGLVKPVDIEAERSLEDYSISYNSRNDVLNDVDEKGLAGIIPENEVRELRKGIYELVPETVRRQIVEKAMTNGLNFREGMDAYLENLAKGGTENDETGLLRVLYNQIRDLSGNENLTDADCRYIIWREGAGRNPLSFILEIAYKNRFGAGQEEPMFSMTAYHGSGSLFDRFSTDHIGEGEGAQSHGWGLYVAFNKGTSERYAQVMGHARTEYIGKKAPTYYAKELVSHIKYEMENGRSFNEAKSKTVEMLRKMVDDRTNGNVDSYWMRTSYEKDLAFFKQLKESDFKTGENHRHLYTVGIPDDTGDNYIDEMKTLAKPLRKRVADVVREIPEEKLVRTMHGPSWLPQGFQTLANIIEREQYAGLEIRERLEDALGNTNEARKEVAEILKKAGFVGIKYEGKLDGPCAVIFNSDDITIEDHTQFSMAKEFADAIDEAREKLDEAVAEAKADLDQAKAENKIEVKEHPLKAVLKAMRDQRTYDKSTVDSIVKFAKEVLRGGHMNDILKQGSVSLTDINYLLNTIKNAEGKAPSYVAKHAENLLDKLIDLTLKYEDRNFRELLSIEGRKVNQQGVEAMGKLDVLGQETIKAVRDYMGRSKEDLEARKVEVSDNLTSEDEAVRKKAWAEQAGLDIAEKYQQLISDSLNEEHDLRQEMEDFKGQKQAKEISANDYKEFVASTNQALRENKLERVDNYRLLSGLLKDAIKGGAERASAFRERERERIEGIHYDANRDMYGMDAKIFNEETKLSKLVNSSLFRFFFQPLATFDQMLRLFAKHNITGEGYLWRRFMPEWIRATENNYLGVADAMKQIDAKTSEVFGRDMKFTDLRKISRKLPKVMVRSFDEGGMRDFEISQLNAMLAYVWDKMPGIRLAIRKMGISSDKIAALRSNLDPRFIELGEWIQNEFFTKRRNKYNAIHEQIFGAPMAAIENYFPVKRAKGSLNNNIDVSQAETDANKMMSTVTGSIIKRTNNTLPVDFINYDMVDIVLEHIMTMETWAAFAPLRKDLNALLSYKHFRNQVMNMNTIYGHGRALWKNFFDVCTIAAGTYTPVGKRTFLLNISKGVTAAKINANPHTALKQLLSYPAFWVDASSRDLYHAAASPVDSWNWCIENLPIFDKRWNKGDLGDTRLMKTDADWELWKYKIPELASKYGMASNRFVDAFTCAIGAKAVYESKFRKYLSYGLLEEEADRKAKDDATSIYNQSQQSSESAFVAAIQLDRTLEGAAVSTFRNANMGYQRRVHNAYRTLGRLLSGDREDYIGGAERQYVSEGMDPEQARNRAEQEYKKAGSKAFAEIGVFQVFLNFLWKLGPLGAAYIIFGNDNDKKGKKAKDAVLTTAITGFFEGLSLGGSLTDVTSKMVAGEKVLDWNFLNLPILQDVGSLSKTLASRGIDSQSVYEFISLLTQSSIGVDPHIVSNIVVAIGDAVNWNMGTAKEIAFLLMRIAQFPQSGMKDFYIDEIQMTAKEASKHNAKELAKRYVKYKRMRKDPLSLLGEEDKETAKRDKTATKKILNEALNSK